MGSLNAQIVSIEVIYRYGKLYLIIIFLVGEWITNKEFREYVGIDSSHVAKRLLQLLNVTCQGTNKGRRYKIADIFQKTLIK